MTGLVEWLLDLEHIRLGDDAPVSLEWQAPYEPWMLFVFAVLLAAAVVLVHRRETGRRALRILAAGLRGGVLALVVALLCRPVLVLQRERVEPAGVALLLDVSRSMERHEQYTDGGLAAAVAAGARLESPAEAGRYSRLELVRRALLADEAAPLRALLEHNHVRLVSFSGRTRALASVRDSQELPEAIAALEGLTADGTATNLPAALAEVTQRGARLAAVVLASDGRSTVPGSLAAGIDAARARKVPVLPLAIGSPRRPRDVAVGPVMAEENVFLRDLIAIRARVSASGLEVPTPLAVQLFDEAAPQDARASQEVRLGGPQTTAEVEFRIRPDRTGRIAYRVEVAPLAGEAETADNADRVEVQVQDEKLRVLYVESYPRFEYRYLKNALLREDTIESSILLLSADPEFAQEGTAPIRRFPETPEEMNRYDVVLFGDVDPGGDWLSAAQAELLVEFVGQRGGGFALIAGPFHAPHRFRGTALEKLVPVRIDPEFLGRYQSTLAVPFRPRLTEEGRQARLFRFHRDPQISAERFETLPGLYWLARTLGPRPGAELLAEHPTLAVGAGGRGAMPLMVLGRYGAGRVFFSATDDTWRWRRHTGEFLHDAFWVQLCRSLMPPTDRGQDRRLVLRSDRRRYAFGQRVELSVEIRDSELFSMLDAGVSLALLDAHGAPAAELRAERVDPASSVFEAWVVPRRPGSYTVQCRDVAPRPGERPAGVAFRVEAADLEARVPEADHQALRRLASETGGRVIPLDQLGRALGEIPDRSVRTPDDISEPLWDSKLVLVLFVGLITTEWVVRKAAGML